MADDAYKHLSHKGKFNRPSEPQTELDHDDLHKQHAEHYDSHNEGMHNSGEHIAELINPGSTKGNSTGGGNESDKSQVPMKTNDEADSSMDRKHEEELEERKR